MLDLDFLDAQFSQIVGAADGSVSPADKLADAYDSYAHGGTIKGALCTGGDKSLLIEAFTTDNTDLTVIKMALKICEYWQSVPVIGIPAHGGSSVVSVVPTFTAYVSVVELTIRGMITSTLFEKPYKRFFGAIETALKTVPITITEMMPGSPPAPVTFVEYLF